MMNHLHEKVYLIGHENPALDEMLKFMGAVPVLVTVLFCRVINSNACLYQIEPLEGVIAVYNCCRKKGQAKVQ